MVRTRSRRLSTAWLVAAAASLCAFAAPAVAFHIPGATYNGSVSGGGTIQFSVSPEGSSVTGLQVNNVPGNFCTFIFAQDSVPVPIANHAFGKSGSFTYSGSFSSKQSAQGSLSLTSSGPGGCSTGPRSWTATTVASPAGSEECVSAQDRVKQAEDAVAKAKKKLKRASTQRAKRRAERKLKRAKEELKAAQAALAASC